MSATPDGPNTSTSVNQLLSICSRMLSGSSKSLNGGAVLVSPTTKASAGACAAASMADSADGVVVTVHGVGRGTRRVIGAEGWFPSSPGDLEGCIVPAGANFLGCLYSFCVVVSIYWRKLGSTRLYEPTLPNNVPWVHNPPSEPWSNPPWLCPRAQ